MMVHVWPGEQASDATVDLPARLSGFVALIWGSHTHRLLERPLDRTGHGAEASKPWPTAPTAIGCVPLSVGGPGTVSRKPSHRQATEKRPHHGQPNPLRREPLHPPYPHPITE